jgi:N-acetylmuramoyl-L-alanine amidase
LRETYSPAVLLEVGFISNVNDNKLFDGRFDDIADEISKAIISVVSKNNSAKRCSACGQLIHE